MRRSIALRQLPISPEDFVVEIGAGPIPFRHTKLILDKYPFDNLERYGDIANTAPLVKADATKLPLADGACDTLFMSHVVEHLVEPEKFIAEAKRCAKYVYLECPSARRELMYAWSFHHWLVEIEDETLVFYRNDIPQIFGDFFHSNYDFLLDMWSEERFESLNNFLYVATDQLTFTISAKTAYERVAERSARGQDKVNYRTPYGRTGMTTVSYPPSARLKMMIWALTPGRLIEARVRLAQKRNRRGRLHLTSDIVTRMRCQTCYTPALRLEDAQMICRTCGQRYTVTNGVFDFDI